MRVVYFDLETGGLAENHPDIQIAAVATESFREIDAFEAKIQFELKRADPQALELNSYDAAAWQKEAKPESVVVGEFSDFLRKHSTLQMVSKRSGRPYLVARLAGHNVAQFDCPRLVQMFKRHNQFLPAQPYQPLDTLQLALWCGHFLGNDLKSYKLTDLCAAFQIESTGAHDALVDVRTCIELSRAMMDCFLGNRTIKNQP